MVYVYTKVFISSSKKKNNKRQKKDNKFYIVSFFLGLSYYFLLNVFNYRFKNLKKFYTTCSNARRSSKQPSQTRQIHLDPITLWKKKNMSIQNKRKTNLSMCVDTKTKISKKNTYCKCIIIHVLCAHTSNIVYRSLHPFHSFCTQKIACIAFLTDHRV